MEIIRQMQERKDLTERERNIRDYLMEHPEAVISMTAKQLGEVSYSSTAAVSRFCRKIGCQFIAKKGGNKGLGLENIMAIITAFAVRIHFS